MNRHTKIVICILAVFIVGMTLSMAFAEPVEAKKYNNKNSIIVTVKDNNDTVKVNCTYNESHKQYLGYKYQNGKRYDVCICYEKTDGMQGGKKGWWTSATDAGKTDGARTDYKHNTNHPVTTVKLHS